MKRNSCKNRKLTTPQNNSVVCVHIKRAMCFLLIQQQGSHDFIIELKVNTRKT